MNAVFQIVTSQGTQCGTFGRTDERRQNNPVRDNRFYLNIQRPAPCSGTISSLRYCYYGPDFVDINNVDEFEVVVGIYRRDANNYVVVSDMHRFSIVIQPNDIVAGEFTCRSFSIEPSGVSIEQDDVLGACIKSVVRQVNRQSPLNLVGFNGDNSYSLMYMDASPNGVCREGNNLALPTSVGDNNLMERTTEVLHLHADIGEVLLLL